MSAMLQSTCTSATASRHGIPLQTRAFSHRASQSLQIPVVFSSRISCDQHPRSAPGVSLSRTHSSTECRSTSGSLASCSYTTDGQPEHERQRHQSQAGGIALLRQGHAARLISVLAPLLRRMQSMRVTIRERHPGLCALGAVAAPMAGASYLQQLQGNYVFVVGFWAWFAAQFAKIFTKKIKEGVWDITAIVDSGGMPSSHSALCMAVTTAVGHKLGLGSPIFAVALAFSLIVMYDAANVRWHAGKQAEVLNIVMADLLEGHPISEKKMKEVLGHTPLQVACGAILGVLVGVFYPTPVTAFP